VEQISEIEEKDLKINIIVSEFEKWADHRLAYAGTDAVGTFQKEMMIIGNPAADRIWQP